MVLKSQYGVGQVGKEHHLDRNHPVSEPWPWQQGVPELMVELTIHEHDSVEEELPLLCKDTQTNPTMWHECLPDAEEERWIGQVTVLRVGNLVVAMLDGLSLPPPYREVVSHKSHSDVHRAVRRRKNK